MKRISALVYLALVAQAQQELPVEITNELLEGESLVGDPTSPINSDKTDIGVSNYEALMMACPGDGDAVFTLQELLDCVRSKIHTGDLLFATEAEIQAQFLKADIGWYAPTLGVDGL